MSPDRTLAVARRVLRQLRHDHRSVAMVLIAPMFLLWLVHETFANMPGVFDRIGPMMLGMFPFVMMFLVTSITMLRERTQGTLDRLMASPVGKADLMAGYALAFLVVAALQSAVALTVGVGLLGMPMEGALWQALVLVFALALFGITLGLFLSAFAHTEFQAVQFMPIVVLPQIFLAGLLVPTERMPGFLEAIARAIPLKYSFAALNEVMIHGGSLFDAGIRTDTLVTLLIPFALLGLGSLTLRRSSDA
jgi:ABC-2 type transport system permease protein